MRYPPTTTQMGYSTMEEFGKKQFKTALSGPPGHFRLSLLTVPVPLRTHTLPQSPPIRIPFKEKLNLSFPPQNSTSNFVDFYCSLWYINGVKPSQNPILIQQEFNRIVSNGIRNFSSGTDWVLFHCFTSLIE